MRKPSTTKLALMIVTGVALLVSIVAFATYWMPSKALVLSGEVQAREIKNSSRLGGRVKQILVKEGEKVIEGQLLIVFEDADLQAKIADARATLTQAQAQERLLAKGAEIGQVRTAGSAVKQAEERLKILSSGGRPEEVVQAESKLKTAEAQHTQAQQTLDNAQVMLEEGIISKQKYESIREAANASKSNLDAAKAALNMVKGGGRPEERRIASSQLSAAKAQYGQLVRGARPEEMSIASANVEKARSALEALEAQLEEVRIRAPFPGYVSVIGVTEGELVAPGRPIISILDYSRLWTDVYVPESKLSQVTLGQPVIVRVRSFRNAEFQGRIALINPRSEFVPNSGGDTSTEEATFRVKIDIPATGKDGNGKISLYPGMKVDVTINP